MTRSELQTKLAALSRAGDAAAVATLEWLTELENKAATWETRAFAGPDPRNPADLTFLKPIADFVAAADKTHPPPGASMIAISVNYTSGWAALTMADMRNIADRYNHSADHIKRMLAAEHAAMAAAASGEFPVADPLAMGKGEAAPPTARNLDALPTSLNGPSPEEVATAATRKANGLPEVPDPTQFAHGDVVRMGTELVPNGGTGEG